MTSTPSSTGYFTTLAHSSSTQDPEAAPAFTVLQMLTTTAAAAAQQQQQHLPTAPPLLSTAPPLLSITTTLSELLHNLTNTSTREEEQEHLSGMNTENTAGLPVFPQYIRVVSTVFCCLVFVVGVVGNILVPVVILRDRDMRTSTNYFLVNLSVADLLVLLFCLPPVLVELHSPPEIWVMGYSMCKLTAYVEMSVIHASALSLVVISLERYQAVVQPLEAGYRCTRTKAVAAIFVIWTMAFVSAGPLLWIIQYGQFQYHDGSTQPSCIMAITSHWAISYIVSSHVIFFFLPMFLLVALYAVIAQRLLVDTYDLTHKKQTPQTRARKQVAVMMATVVFFFFLCLLPIRVFFLWIIAVPQESQQSLGVEGFYNILYFCRVMIYINSSINPILYNVTSTKFRNAFRRVFRGRQRHSQLSRQHTTCSNASYNTTNSTKTLRLHYGANCSLVYRTMSNKTCGHHTFTSVSSNSASSQVTRQTSRSHTPARDTLV